VKTHLRLIPLLLLLATAATAANPVVPVAPPVPAAPVAPGLTREQLLARLDQERASAGLPPLHPVELLDRVAQQSAEAIRGREGAVFDLDSLNAIRDALARAGYRPHGWTHSFSALTGDADAVVAWWKTSDPQSFQALVDPDYQDVGIGVSDLHGTPLYTFLLAWRESAYFGRQTAGLADLAAVRAAMLARVNALRTGAGVPPLTLQDQLDDAAQRHAEDMLARGFYDHVNPEGLQPKDRIARTGYPTGLVAENIARGATSVDEVVDAWMKSQGHRANLLHPRLTEMGVGCAVGHVGSSALGDTVYWVQDFGRPR
jgi:uncharacterized protein YkwD